MTPTPPVLVDTDVNEILAWYVAYYQAQTGITLNPGQVEMVILNAIAAREVQNRALWQSIGVGNLIDFASAPVLDYLVALLGVTRLSAQPAQVNITFTIVSGAGAVTIPQGTRIQSTDGQATFALMTDIFVPAGTGTITATCQCNAAGSFANNYAINTITQILDPQPFITSATNAALTGGGSDPETDVQLRSRAKLASSAFSVAGPVNAYKYWAKSANPLIVDVGVTNPVPGTVNIYPLVPSENPVSSDIIAQVQAAISPTNVRPLCDTPIVLSPTRISFALVVNVTKLTGGVDAQIQSDVQNALQPFLSGVGSTLGTDILTNKLTQLVMEVANVYTVNFGSFSDMLLSGDESKYNYCTGITVNIIGTH